MLLQIYRWHEQQLPGHVGQGGAGEVLSYSYQAGFSCCFAMASKGGYEAFGTFLKRILLHPGHLLPVLVKTRTKQIAHRH